jgi:chaperonin cofactor prefoldin
MRFAGLSICLLVSTLSARAEALETQVTTLEERIKTLEEALQNQGAEQQGSHPAAPQTEN